MAEVRVIDEESEGPEQEGAAGRSYEELFRPIKVRNLVIPNRLAGAPTVHNLATEDGYVNDALRGVYREKARGGWGMITVEATYIRPDGSNFRRMLGCYSDRCIAGLNDLAEIIQEGGARASIQLMHGGRVANPTITGAQPVAPSADAPPFSAVPHQLTDNEIEEMIDLWAHMAAQCKGAKFDMVTIHGAHGMLATQFFSPFTNLRKDRWGDREFFILELIRRVRNAVGPDFPIVMRWSADEMIGSTGYTLADTVAFAPKMVAAGVDALDISAGIFESYDWIIQPMYMNRGCLVHMADAVKKVVDVPVLTAGRINSVAVAARIVREGRADIVSMARQAIADPLTPRKLREKRVRDIRMCIACDTCSDYEGNQRSLKCAVNYEFGRTHELRLAPADHPKKVLVIGAGVAGLEAARVAKMRGHDVTVWEARDSLGGAVRHVASAIPNLPRELGALPTWYVGQMKSLEIDLEFGRIASAESVAAFAPDAVVVATGSRPSVPEIPGLDLPHVH
ncbi:MAG: FAD-dependent oxidoreductase, partial [Actinobacteria bacterium]|nr:FAD-dependent oxidoreductase [Actinomycetota bacterium]